MDYLPQKRPLNIWQPEVAVEGGWLFLWKRVSRTFDELATLLHEVLDYVNVIKQGHLVHERHLLNAQKQ